MQTGSILVLRVFQAIRQTILEKTLLAVAIGLLHLLGPGARVEALSALNRLIDWDLVAEEVEHA